MTGRRTPQIQALFVASAVGLAGWLAGVGPALAASGQAAPAAPAARGASSGVRTGDPRAAQAQAAPSTPGLVGFEWWNSPEVKKDLGLTEDKAKHLDDMYQQRSKQLRPLADELDKQRKELDRMTSERTVEDNVLLVQVVMVESLRSQLSQSRTMMLYRMSRELTADQNKKLLEIVKRNRDQFGQGRSFSPGPGAGR